MDPRIRIPHQNVTDPQHWHPICALLTLARELELAYEGGEKTLNFSSFVTFNNLLSLKTSTRNKQKKPSGKQLTGTGTFLFAP
jgi:hypothetical protein